MIGSSDQTIADRNTVHVWSVALDEAELDLPELLSDDEISRLGRIHHSRARLVFLRSRVALRLILASYLDCPGTDIIFNYNENGKPALSSDKSHSLTFNLSHSGNHCLLAVAKESDLGVDIEQLHSGRDYAALAQRFFTPAEHDLLENSQDEGLFYRMWVLKEASVKVRGIKLLSGLDRFQCSVSEQGVLNVSDKLGEIQPGNWSVRQWQPDDQSIAAIVVRCADAVFVDKNTDQILSRLEQQS